MRVLLLCVLLIGAYHLTVSGQETGKPEYLFRVFFGGGSYYIDGQQRLELADFILEIPHIEEYIVEIHGHTDNIGSREYNRRLAELRTESVEYLLLENLVSESAIEIKPFGEEQPTYSNQSWSGQRMNRRVDIIFRRIQM